MNIGQEVTSSFLVLFVYIFMLAPQNKHKHTHMHTRTHMYIHTHAFINGAPEYCKELHKSKRTADAGHAEGVLI